MKALHRALRLSLVLAALGTSACQGRPSNGPPADVAIAISPAADAGTVVAPANDALDAGASAKKPVEEPVDPEVESVRLYLLEVDKALAAKNGKALAKLVHFPIRASYLDYAMELRTKSATLSNAAAAMKKKGLWVMPEGFIELAKNGPPRRGVDPCDQDGGSAPVDEYVLPDWTRGRPAIEVHGDTATVVAETGPCQVDHYRQVWHLKRVNAAWTLVKTDADND